MKMKKVFAAVAAAVMALSATACASTNEESGNSGAASGSADGKVYNIGICQLVQHEALDAATKGFKDVLIEKLGEDNVKFDEQNANGESTNCTTICNGFAAANVDLILANATGALQAASAATATIPIRDRLRHRAFHRQLDRNYRHQHFRYFRPRSYRPAG